MKKLSTKNIDVTWDYDFQKKLREGFSNEEWARRAQDVIDLSIARGMQSGVSPVNGFKNFTKYKNPSKYPGDLKASNKPNLYVTGKLYGAYKSQPGKSPMSITMGVHKNEDPTIQVIAKANNEGTEHIPARRFIPLKGETYKTSIILEIRKLFAIILGNAINKKGK